MEGIEVTKTTRQIVGRATVGAGVAATMAKMMGLLVAYWLSLTFMPKETQAQLVSGIEIIGTTLFVGIGVWARENKVPILSMIGVLARPLAVVAALGLGVFAAAPASADAPVAGCNGDGCSIYFVEYEWPATVGVNAAEFLRVSFGVGPTGLSADTDVTYLGGLCLIPGVRDTPVCPAPAEDEGGE